MPRTKKVKIGTEILESPIVESSVVEAKIVEKTKEVVAPAPIKESEARQELRRIYAIRKAQNPELYAAKNKDAKLERELSKLQ